MEVITGATGCLGGVLARQLISKGKKVRVLIRSTSNLSLLDGLKAEKIKGNLLDKNSLVRAFKGADIVYHLAGLISIMPGDRKLIRRNNLDGTRNVIEACIRCKVKRLVYTSTISAIKVPPDGTVIDESMPFDTDSRRGEYDRSKAIASLEVIRAASNGLDSVVVCPTGIMGPYDFRKSLMTRTFIDFVRGKMNINVNGAYDFVDVRDVAEGIILAAEKGRKSHFYILSGERITMDEMIKELAEVSGVNPPGYILPAWLVKTAGLVTPLYYKISGKTPRFTYYSIATLQSNSHISHKKASSELGYSPRPVRESIRDTFFWLKENNML